VQTHPGIHSVYQIISLNKIAIAESLIQPNLFEMIWKKDAAKGVFWQIKRPYTWFSVNALAEIECILSQRTSSVVHEKIEVHTDSLFPGTGAIRLSCTCLEAKYIPGE